jgi:hypothetical protein
MDVYRVMQQVVEWLRRDGRVSYRALQQQFNLDDNTLDEDVSEVLVCYSLGVYESESKP